MPEDRRSYIVFRPDGLVIHTRPITREEAEWLLREAYNKFKRIEVKARYLSQWGSVLNVSPVKWIKELGLDGVYSDLSELAEKLKALKEAVRYESDPSMPNPWLVMSIEEMLDAFLKRPVEPRPLERRPRPAVRYEVVFHRHVLWDGALRREYTVPRALWHAYVDGDAVKDEKLGVSVFPDSFWLWRQWRPYTYMPSGRVEAVIVRRDASDEEVMNAIINEARAAKFLREHAAQLSQVVDKNADEMRQAGHDDVAKRAKKTIASAFLLTA